MKVKKLIEELSKLDPEAEVILQKDSEGNGYKSLYGVDGNAVTIREDGEYSVYDADWTADEADMDEKDWNKILKKKRSVILFPGD